MKIYLAGSIAGGREFAKNLILISDTLEKLGHKVVTKKNVVLTLPGYAGAKILTDRKRIMKRDKRWIASSDAFIAEVSQYSHGVGYEHRFAEDCNLPILLLRHKSLEKNSYSAFLDGTDYKKFKFAFYDEKNIQQILVNFFEKYAK